MKQFSSDLLALLQRNRTVWPNADFSAIFVADLFKIGPVANGQMLYATNGQGPITYEGNVYQPTQFGNWGRGALTNKIGLEAGTVDLTVSSGQQDPVYFPGTNKSALLIDGIKFGLLDAAPVTIYTVYMPVYGQVNGPSTELLSETKFVGSVTAITQLGITTASLTVSDPRYLLNVSVPQRQVSANCWWVLYSTGCTLSKNSFYHAGVIATVDAANQNFTTTAHIAVASPSGTFTQGVLTWTSGNNSGLSNAVRLWTPGGSSDTIMLDIPAILPVAAGDAFNLYQGCDHTYASCIDLQGATNAAKNFGGFPTVPVAETSI